MEKILISVREFCALTGLGRTKAYELIRSEEIASLKIGRLRKIRAADIEVWLNKQVECGD